ncbi:MAG: hypothetical protein ACI9UK_000184 [Candidatus Krumholzibacteriia bacterium]|jgi:hypothetical protein
MALLPIANLVAGYVFDNDTLDSGPNSLHGTGAGLVSTTGTAEAPDTAYQYDGFSAYMSVPYSSLFTSTNQISIAMWVNVSALPSASGAALVSAAYSDGVADFNKTFSPFSHNLSVGAQKASSAPGGYNAYFAGKIDNLFIFDNALTDFEIGEFCIQAVATESSSWGGLKAAYR